MKRCHRVHRVAKAVYCKYYTKAEKQEDGDENVRKGSCVCAGNIVFRLFVLCARRYILYFYLNTQI